MSGKETLPPHVEYWLSSDSIHDCYFIVGPESGPTQIIGSFKAFLIAHSEPFRVMLQDNYLREEGGYISIVDIKPDTFMKFLKCLYMNCENLGQENLSFLDYIDLLYVADKYLVTYLREKLVVRLMCFMTPGLQMSYDDFFIALSSPVFLRVKRLEKLFGGIIGLYLKQIFSFPSFLNISSDSLLWILKLDSVGTNEIILWQGVLKWAIHKAGSEEGHILRQVLLKHLKFIRFCTMTCNEVCEKVVPTNILTHSELYEVCKSLGNRKPPNMEFICNNISFRNKNEGNNFSFSNKNEEKLETTFSFCVSDITNFSKASKSKNITFQGFDWNVMVSKLDGYCSIHVTGTTKKSSWERSVTVSIILINHKFENLSLRYTDKFTTGSKTRGSKYICLWDELIEPSNKYVFNNSIIILVHLAIKN